MRGGIDPEDTKFRHENTRTRNTQNLTTKRHRLSRRFGSAVAGSGPKDSVKETRNTKQSSTRIANWRGVGPCVFGTSVSGVSFRAAKTTL